MKWLCDKMWKAWDGSQAGFFFFLFFWLGSGLYAAGGSPTEPDADSQTSFSFLDLICMLPEAPPTESDVGSQTSFSSFWTGCGEVEQRFH